MITTLDALYTDVYIVSAQTLCESMKASHPFHSKHPKMKNGFSVSFFKWSAWCVKDSVALYMSSKAFSSKSP